MILITERGNGSPLTKKVYHMLKFKRLPSGIYRHTLANGNFLNIEKHGEEDLWIGVEYTEDYEEVAHTFCLAKTKKELVQSFSNQY